MHDDPLLIETICIRNGEMALLGYHNQRASQSRKVLFGISMPIDLSEYIDVDAVTAPWAKCRIIYDRYIRSIQYQPYIMKPIKTLTAVDVPDDYRYDHKYQDRSVLDQCYTMRGASDDVLIMREGLVTDTYYGNVALERDGHWYTPKSPLLRGTRRQDLLDRKAIIEIDIKRDDVPSYSKISIFNAMIDFGEIVLDTADIMLTHK